MTELPHDSPDGWCLECAGLGVRRGKRLAVRDVSITLRGGECVSLVGPNGSGKTTLLLALLGLLRPAGGTVCLNGRDMHRIPARQRGRFAAYVPQIVDSAPALAVGDVVGGGRYPHAGAIAALSPADRVAIDRALERCGLKELSERPFNAISGGERQKTLIAAAIAQDPRVMFLDEPSTALDPAYQAELVRILREWHGAGRGLVVISHDLQLPAALGGRIIAMKEGNVAADGPAASILTPDALASIYGARFAMATTADGALVALPEWWLADAGGGTEPDTLVGKTPSRQGRP